MAISPQRCGASLEELKDQEGAKLTASPLTRSFASSEDGAGSRGDGNDSEYDAWLHDFAGSFKGGDSDQDSNSEDEEDEDGAESHGDGNDSEYDPFGAGSFKGGDSDDEDSNSEDEEDEDTAEDKAQVPFSPPDVKTRASGGRPAVSSEGSHTTRLSSSGSTQPDAASSDESGNDAADPRKEFRERARGGRVVPCSSPTRARCSPCIHEAPAPASAPEADLPTGDGQGDFVFTFGEPVSERPIAAGPSGLLLQAIAACKPAAVCVQSPAAPKAIDRPDDWTPPSPRLDTRPPVQDDYDMASATLAYAEGRRGSGDDQRREDLKMELNLKRAQALGLLAACRRRPDLETHYSCVRAEVMEEVRALEVVAMSLGWPTC